MVIELTSELQTRLTRMAEATDRSEADLANEAMNWFLAPRESNDEIVARGRQQIADGQTIGHDELFEQIFRMIRD